MPRRRGRWPSRWSQEFRRSPQCAPASPLRGRPGRSGRWEGSGPVPTGLRSECARSGRRDLPHAGGHAVRGVPARIRGIDGGGRDVPADQAVGGHCHIDGTAHQIHSVQVAHDGAVGRLLGQARALEAFGHQIEPGCGGGVGRSRAPGPFGRRTSMTVGHDGPARGVVGRSRTRRLLRRTGESLTPCRAFLRGRLLDAAAVLAHLVVELVEQALAVVLPLGAALNLKGLEVALRRRVHVVATGGNDNHLSLGRLAEGLLLGRQQLGGDVLVEIVAQGAHRVAGAPDGGEPLHEACPRCLQTAAQLVGPVRDRLAHQVGDIPVLLGVAQDGSVALVDTGQHRPVGRLIGGVVVTQIRDGLHAPEVLLPLERATHRFARFTHQHPLCSVQRSVRISDLNLKSSEFLAFSVRHSRQFHRRPPVGQRHRPHRGRRRRGGRQYPPRSPRNRPWPSSNPSAPARAQSGTPATLR